MPCWRTTLSMLVDAAAELERVGSPPPASEASGGEGSALRSNFLDPPPGSVLRTSPPSPPLVQVGCFRLGPIDKWPNPGTPGVGGGGGSGLTFWAPIWLRQRI